MILADTSAWVEFLRMTGSAVNDRLRELVAAQAVATTDVVMMEVLAGARDELHRRRLRALLGRCEYVRTMTPEDFERAATLSVRCRREGLTIRRMTDCLIAAVALRAGASVLHRDRDFEGIASCSSLRLESVGPESAEATSSPLVGEQEGDHEAEDESVDRDR